jgi:hypothetical protein
MARGPHRSRSALNRRDFLGLATLAASAGLAAAAPENPELKPLPPAREKLPTGKIGGVEYSRLMLGGNLVSGYAHARDLAYVATLMKRYNTEARILETLEIAEAHSINAINLAIWDDLSYLQKHWRRGGKMKLIAQALPENGDRFAQFKKAVDFGASAVHLQGHGAERLVQEENVAAISAIVDYLRSQKVAAGVAAHALSVITQCEAAGLNVDFYQKTLHTRSYHSAPRQGDTHDLGSWDNSWCADADEVVETMARVKKPWIAFKVMAAGAISPQRAFPHAFNGGADFILAGMFDWQIEEDVQVAKRALGDLERTRPWH